MHRPARPRRRALRAAVASCTLLALPALLPAAASADYAAANTWGGGTVGPERSSDLNGAFPVKGAVVSMVTGPSRARLSVSIRGRSCAANGTLRGTVVAQPGAVGEQLALGVTARKTVSTGSRTGTLGRTRARVVVTLGPAAPGVLTGTITARGRTNLGGRVHPCRMSERITLRSRAALVSPLQPLGGTPATASWAGILETRIAPRVRGAIAITRRRDGLYHGLWSVREFCVSGSKRTADEFVDIGKAFRIRKDGTFRGHESTRYSRRLPEGRQRVHFVGTISGRIGPDGVARGRVSIRVRYKLTGYLDAVCTVPSTPFAAAPVA